MVTAGPFAADKIDSTVEQLRAKGFAHPPDQGQGTGVAAFRTGKTSRLALPR